MKETHNPQGNIPRKVNPVNKNQSTISPDRNLKINKKENHLFLNSKLDLISNHVKNAKEQQVTLLSTWNVLKGNRYQLIINFENS